MQQTLQHTTAHGYRKQTILHFLLFSGKQEVCSLVHDPEHGQGFESPKRRSPTHLHTASPALPKSAAVGHWPRGHLSWLGHTHKAHEEGERGGGRRGPVTRCYTAALPDSPQVPRLLFVTPRTKEKVRLKEDDATCSVYAMVDER